MPINPAAKLAMTSLAMAGLFIMLPGCGDGDAVGASEAQAATAVRTVHFEVGGMHCEGCAAGVRSAISRVNGVQRCTVSFPDANAEVQIDENGDADDIVRRIIERVAEEGFTIEPRGT